MKRGFLFGLGAFLIVAALGGVGVFLTMHDVITGVGMALICAPLGVIVLWRARITPSDQSKLREALGWLIGFLIINAAIIAFALVSGR